MVSIRATMVGLMKVTELETETTALIRREARPVAVMQPEMMPAMPQATTTVMVLLPPASRASRILLTLTRFSLSKRLTKIVAKIARVAENCMERALVETSATSSTRGVSR